MLHGVASARREERGHPSPNFCRVGVYLLLDARKAVHVTLEVYVAAERSEGDTARVFAHHRLHAWQGENRDVLWNVYFFPCWCLPAGKARHHLVRMLCTPNEEAPILRARVQGR